MSRPQIHHCAACRDQEAVDLAGSTQLHAEVVVPERSAVVATLRPQVREARRSLDVRRDVQIAAAMNQVSFDTASRLAMALSGDE